MPEITKIYPEYDDHIQALLVTDQKLAGTFIFINYLITKPSLNLDDFNLFKTIYDLQSMHRVPVIINLLDNHAILSENLMCDDFINLDFMKEALTSDLQEFSKEKPETIMNMNSKQLKKLVCEKTGAFKELYKHLAINLAAVELTKWILSIGFNTNQTFIYRTSEYIGQNGGLYENIIKFGGKISIEEANLNKNWDYSTNVDALTLMSKDIAAIFGCSYKTVFGDAGENMLCLVVSRREENNKMRLARTMAYQCDLPMPFTIQIEHLPSLSGNGPMKSEDENSAILLSDSEKIVGNKVRKYAFSGGGDTIEEHRKNGGNCDADVCYQYLRFLMSDEEKLVQLGEGYSTGQLLTGDLKKTTIGLINEIIGHYTTVRSSISEEMVTSVMTPRLLQFEASEHTKTSWNNNYDAEAEAALLAADVAEQARAMLQKRSSETTVTQVSEDVSAADAGGDIVTPWEVAGDAEKGIDYDKLVERYGSSKIEADLVDQLSRVTGHKTHHFMRRGIFYSHRDLNEILEMAAGPKRSNFFLYTGRGPSSDALHLGHMVPFIFTGWLRRALRVPLVVQLTDDEKCLMRGLARSDVARMTRENARDIIAALQLDECAHSDHTTFIFSDFDYTSSEPAFQRTAARIRARVNLTTTAAIFGFGVGDAIEKVAFPGTQAATSFSCAFPGLFGRSGQRLRSLIPCAIDQDPYFRMTRDVAPKLRLPKPALVHSRFFPSLQGHATKMNASDPASAIFMTDSEAQIRHKLLGGEHSAQRDSICVEYLSFFLEDDDELARIEEGFKMGSISGLAVRERLVDVLIPMVMEHQRRRANVNDDVIDWFMRPRHLVWN